MITKLVNAFKRKNYRLYDTGDYNVNLFGIRNTVDKDSNAFNDTLGILYTIRGEFRLFTCAGTTDPGTVSRTCPVNPAGTAILPLGQYVKAFKLGFHKGKYPALVQNVPLPLYRDNNKDGKLDFTNLQEPAMCGINFHRANANHTSVQVDSWSAGCQVVANPVDFGKIMQIIYESAARYGDKFTYTLFSDKDVY